MITAYNPDSQDWSNNGLGVLLPTVCVAKEDAGGDYSLEIEHPLDEDQRWQMLQRGYLVKAPVPERETPLIQQSAEARTESPEHIIWEVTAATGSVYSKASSGYSSWSSGATYSKGAKRNYGGKSYRWGSDIAGNVTPPASPWVRITTGSKRLKRLAQGTEVIYHEDEDTWSRITTPDGTTGYILKSSIAYKRTEPFLSAQPAYNTAVPPRQIRDQVFRIYDVQIDDNAKVVRASARHIHYDQLGNLIKEYNPSAADAQSALIAMSADCLNDHDFSYYTNIDADITAEWARKNVIAAIHDPDNGAVPKLQAQLVCDNYDTFLLQNVERDRGVVIEYGKNMLGITSKVNDEAVVTRIMPIGYDADGNPILLPEYCVDSQFIGEYATERAVPLDAQEAKVHAAEGEDPGMTLEQAYTKMRNAAQAEFDKGCDLVDLEITVDFVHLGDTVEYAQYKDLQQVFLYDTVTVRHSRLGIDYKTQVIGYEFDSILSRYVKIILGSIKNGANLGAIAGFQLPSMGISGTKLVPGSVGSTQLQQLAVLNAHIGNLAVNAAKIQDASIETAKIADAAITNAKIGTAAIDTANIKDASITDAKIGTAGIDFAKIKDLLAGTAIFTQGIGDELFIGRLYVTAANIAHLEVGELVFKDGDGNLWRLGVDGEGEVTATPVEVEYQNISDGALLSISEYTVYKSGTAPTSPYVGQLWLNTSTDIVSRCTAISPSIVWEPTKSSELHTSYIAATEKGLEILSSGIIEVKSGGTLGIKSLGQLLLEAGSGVDINTTNFRIRDDDRELMTVDESGVRVGADILAAPNIIGNVPNTFAGGTIPWAGSFQASLNNIGKWLLAESTLTVSGDISEDVMVPVFIGSRLNIKFASGAKLYGKITFNNCANVRMYADAQNTTNIIGNGADYVILLDSSHVVMDNLHISGKVRTSASDATSYGIRCENASSLTINACTIDRTKDVAVLANTNCKVDVYNCKGGVAGGDYTTLSNAAWGIYAQRNADVSLYNTIPFGASGGASQWLGEIRGTATNTPTDGTTPAAPSTRSYAVSAGYTAKDDSSGGSSVSWSAGEPRQGSWGEYVDDWGYTVLYGFGLFLLTGAANIVSDRPAGKTITAATLKLRRDATAGTSGTISCTPYQHNLTSAPSGAPNTVLFAQAANSVSIKPNEEAVITLNASAIAALNAGTCKGFGFRSSGGYGRYDVFGELTVTYA